MDNGCPSWRLSSPTWWAAPGRAFVDLDGISVLPNFDAAKRSSEHALFEKLISESKGQRLLSGLARAIWRIGRRLAQTLDTKPEELLEYVLNQRDIWDDARLAAAEKDGEDDEGEDRLEEQIADLDVALFSLIEPLDTDVSQLATVIDEVLKDSLWEKNARAAERTHTGTRTPSFYVHGLNGCGVAAQPSNARHVFSLVGGSGAFSL